MVKDVNLLTRNSKNFQSLAKEGAKNGLKWDDKELSCEMNFLRFQSCTRSIWFLRIEHTYIWGVAWQSPQTQGRRKFK
jgi:hypothetical protein